LVAVNVQRAFVIRGDHGDGKTRHTVGKIRQKLPSEVAEWPAKVGTGRGQGTATMLLKPSEADRNLVKATISVRATCLWHPGDGQPEPCSGTSEWLGTPDHR
jgi:hypothetical protein